MSGEEEELSDSHHPVEEWGGRPSAHTEHRFEFTADFTDRGSLSGSDVVVDSNGEAVGKLRSVYLNDGQLTWAVVRLSDLPSSSEKLVPLLGSTTEGKTVKLAVDSQTIKDSPAWQADEPSVSDTDPAHLYWDQILAGANRLEHDRHSDEPTQVGAATSQPVPSASKYVRPPRKAFGTTNRARRSVILSMAAVIASTASGLLTLLPASQLVSDVDLNQIDFTSVVPYVVIAAAAFLGGLFTQLFKIFKRLRRPKSKLPHTWSARAWSKVEVANGLRTTASSQEWVS